MFCDFFSFRISFISQFGIIHILKYVFSKLIIQNNIGVFIFKIRFLIFQNSFSHFSNFVFAFFKIRFHIVQNSSQRASSNALAYDVSSV